MKRYICAAWYHGKCTPPPPLTRNQITLSSLFTSTRLPRTMNSSTGDSLATSCSRSPGPRFAAANATAPFLGQWPEPKREVGQDRGAGGA